MKAKNFAALLTSMPLPKAAGPPYFKHLPPPLQTDHFKSHGYGPVICQ